MRRDTCVLCGIIALLVLDQSDVQQVKAQEDSIEAAAQEARKVRLERMKATVSVYKVTSRSDPDAQLEFQSNPVFRWSAPSRDIQDAAIFLFTSDGRPEVAMQVIMQGDRWIQMMSSLSAHTLQANGNGDPIWSPDRPGVEMRPVPEAADPAETASARLIQMRLMTRDFDAVYFYKGEDRFSMRMLPQPLYRYGQPDGEILDGGLFAFVDGTNAKLLLLFEARRTEAGDRWDYGIAPITVHKAQVTLKEEDVFSVPYRSPPFDPHEPLFNQERRIEEGEFTEKPTE